MSDTKYNGWANYETWLVKLWMDNEESAQVYWLDLAGQALTDAEETPDPHGIDATAEQTARYTLVEALKSEHEAMYLDALGSRFACSLFSDMLGAAFASVDWHEIADALLESACEVKA